MFFFSFPMRDVHFDGIILLTDSNVFVVAQVQVVVLQVAKIGEVNKVRWELAGEVVHPQVSAKSICCHPCWVLPDQQS